MNAEDVHPISLIEIEVRREIERQDMQFGAQDHQPPVWITILGEEYGEICRAHLEKDHANYEAECVQVAAVAIQMLYNFRKQQPKSSAASKEP